MIAPFSWFLWPWQERLAALAHERAESSAESGELRAQLERLQREYDATQELMRGVLAQARADAEACKRLQAELDRLHACGRDERAAAERAEQEHRSAVEARARAIGELEARVRELDEAELGLKGRLATEAKKAEDLGAHLRAARLRIEQLEQAGRALEAEVSRHRSTCDELTDQKAAAQIELDALSRHAAECERRWTAASKENAFMKEQIAAGSSKLEELGTRLKAVTRERDELLKQVEDLKAQIAQLLARLPKPYQKPRHSGFIS